MSNVAKGDTPKNSIHKRPIPQLAMVKNNPKERRSACPGVTGFPVFASTTWQLSSRLPGDPEYRTQAKAINNRANKMDAIRIKNTRR